MTPEFQHLLLARGELRRFIALWPSTVDVENSSKDIATKQFLKLLALLRIIFLQNSVFLRQKYPRHPLFDHPLYFLPEYGVFAEEVLANSVDKTRIKTP